VGIDVLPSIIGPGGILRRQAIERIKAKGTDNIDRAARIEKEVARGIQPPSPDGLSLDQGLEAIGWNRNYKMPELYSGAPVPMRLGPGQWLTGMAGEGLAVLTVLTEFIPV